MPPLLRCIYIILCAIWFEVYSVFLEFKERLEWVLKRFHRRETFTIKIGQIIIWIMYNKINDTVDFIIEILLVEKTHLV